MTNMTRFLFALGVLAVAPAAIAKSYVDYRSVIKKGATESTPGGGRDVIIKSHGERVSIAFKRLDPVSHRWKSYLPTNRVTASMNVVIHLDSGTYKSFAGDKFTIRPIPAR
jgi:hypothetical protein